MEANNSSSSSWNFTMSETFKGKGATMASLLLAMYALGIAAIVYKCIRVRRNDAEVDVQADVELPARD